ncbi:molybdenum cofactor guanylyltransferase MobA [Thiocapsa sp.]|uniref:molybdenum cofactor guanylyltransferase MobA n=1 Tax=Thiocapsa sp. TaxID=2024551 RepID=UPI002C120393|nr:molybdenum cofactor guanylyltransferase MobA [Thiocapsa sp.]HSO83080.1 molybdenum cofactor guanylyltransferase MobA [Thiocapsa sp.]
MKRTVPTPNDITGVILAGGRGSRMGGVDKGLAELAGRPLIEWVLDALAPQVGALLINANRHREIYAGYGVPVIADSDPGFKGPLAGMLSAMREARTDWILTVPCDGPLLPSDLVSRLIAALASSDAPLATVIEGERIHPVYALVPVSLEKMLAADLAAGTRKVADWVTRHRPALADFSNQPRAFANINSAEDVARLATQLMQPR